MTIPPTLRPGIERIVWIPPTLLGITLVTFALMQAAPGDPASLRAGEGRGATPERIADYRALAGLDRPFLERYGQWLVRSAGLDFGLSTSDGRPARTRVAEALPVTVALGSLAALLALGCALGIGTWSAARRGRRDEQVVGLILSVAYGVPAAVIALLLIRAGAPLSNAGSGHLPSLRELLAPAVCLALPSVVVLARHHRAALVTALTADYVRTARAVGASPRRALLGHALRNAMLPLVTLSGTLVPALLSGSVVVERIFGLHGVGMLGCDALLDRDYPTLMALTTLAALLTVAGSLAADAGAWLLDPRLRQRGVAPPSVPR